MSPAAKRFTAYARINYVNINKTCMKNMKKYYSSIMFILRPLASISVHEIVVFISHYNTFGVICSLIRTSKKLGISFQRELGQAERELQMGFHTC